MDRSDARRRFKVVAGGGEIEQLDRFLAATDPVLIASLQTEEQGLRRQKLRRTLLATALGLALAIPFVLWGSGARLAGGFAGEAPDTEKALLLAEEAWKLFAEDREAEALANFNLATRLAPGLSDAWEGLGTCYTELYQTELAEKTYLRAIDLDPHNVSAIDGLGNLYLRRGDERKAEETWMMLGGRERQLARLYLLQGRFPQAEALLASLLASPQPADDELLYRMAKAARSRRLDNGLRSLLEPEPTGRTPWAAQGWRLWQANRHQEAAAAFAKALSAVPTDVNALGGMGWTLYKLDQPREARDYFERALTLDGDHVLSLNGRAHCLKGEGRTDDAITVWQAMSLRYPGVNIGTPGLAWTYYEKQDYGQAAVQFARLIRRHPYDSRLADALNVAVENIAGPQSH